MSVIIRLQNLPWSANALDIRNYFRGLSIPEGGVHIVGGELGDAFIAFSTDEDARQAMMLDSGKIKEIQVKLLLSSRSEMHKVIEAARQTVPILSLAPMHTLLQPAPAPAPPVQQIPTPQVIPTPFSAALGNHSISNYGIPGLGNPQEIPQPAVIEPPGPLISPNANTPNTEEGEDEKTDTKRKERRRSRTRSRSRDRDRKDRKRDRRDRSRSRDRRRRDRSRSRDRRDRKRDRKDRSRSRDRSDSRRSRDRRPVERRSPGNSQDSVVEVPVSDMPLAPAPPTFGMNSMGQTPTLKQLIHGNVMPNGASFQNEMTGNRFSDPSITDTYSKLQELGKKRNPNAFQGEQQNGAGRVQGGRGGLGRGGANFRRDGRASRFDNDPLRDCCVAIRNAPNHTSYGDVRRFFPFLIDKHGIKMINDASGRRTGNIFVRFCDTRSKQLALQRKQNELKGAEVLVEELDGELYENAVDSFLPFREDNDDEDEALIIADDSDVNSPFSVVKLSDLPHFVKEHDLVKAFSDFSLLSIMLKDCRITRTKIAFVQFVKPEDARLAFEQREKYVFGKRQAKVVPVTNDEYDKEKNSQIDKVTEPTRPPILESRPENAPPRDPRQRRQQFDNGAPNPVGPPMQGGPQGAPFFPAPFPQQQGFPGPFGGPQFGAFPGPASLDPRTAPNNWANRPPFPNNQMEQMPGNVVDVKPNPTNMEDEPLDCVLMKGLPRDATDRTIVTFLSDTGAVPARIHLMLDSNGMPSGDCFCEFRSAQEARMAATKHGDNLDGCRVTVDLVPRSVVEEALDGPKQPEMQGGLLGNGPPQFYDQSMRGGFPPRGTVGGFRGRGGYDRGSFERGGYNRGGFDQSRGGFDQSRGGFDQNRGGFDQSRGGFDQSRGGFDQGRGGFDQNRNMFRGRGGFDRGGRGGFDRGRGRGFSRGRGGFENGNMNRPEEDQDPALDDFGAPGCVASMENVPFRATIDDILNFFAEFELTQDDVIRRYNERGQPTGDARVAFRTPFDAQRAVKTRHMDMIHDRRISLCIL